MGVARSIGGGVAFFRVNFRLRLAREIRDDPHRRHLQARLSQGNRGLAGSGSERASTYRSTNIGQFYGRRVFYPETPSDTFSSGFSPLHGGDAVEADPICLFYARRFVGSSGQCVGQVCSKVAWRRCRRPRWREVKRLNRFHEVVDSNPFQFSAISLKIGGTGHGLPRGRSANRRPFSAIPVVAMGANSGRHRSGDIRSRGIWPSDPPGVGVLPTLAPVGSPIEQSELLAPTRHPSEHSPRAAQE